MAAADSTRQELNDLIYDVDDVHIPEMPDIDFLPQKYAVEHPPSSYKFTSTAYMYFLGEQRDRILRDESLKFETQSQFKAYLKKVWDRLSPKAKAKYQAKASTDTKRFYMVLETINHDDQSPKE